MYTYTANRSMLLAAALSCCLIFTNTTFAADPGGSSRTKIVNCNKGGASVQSAIDQAQIGQDTTIFIVGFCDESVNIVKDGITLSGNKIGDDMIGGGLTEVTVIGAKRVLIEYLELTGAGYGVLVDLGASVEIRNNNIHDNLGGDGVGVYNQSFARVEFNTITGNGRTTHFEAGMESGTGAVIRSRGNYVAENAYAAIEFGNMSYFRSGLFIPIDGGSPDPADRDTFLQRGCSLNQDADQCADDAAPNTVAVDCFRNGLCDFRNTRVIGSIFISGMSNLEVRTSTINGNINGSSGSRLHLRNSVTGSGFVSCFTNAFATSSIQCGTSIPQ